MLYFDFDGTLADVWQRYYHVFRDASGITGMSLEEYIRVKREFPQDSDVARMFGGTLPEEYKAEKRSRLEDPTYLAYDQLIVPAEQICAFFREHDCRILTNRRSAEMFRGQLISLGLEELISKAVVLNPNEKIKKVQYLQMTHPNESIVLVGDAEAEAQVSVLKQAEVYLVRTGLRDPQSLPDAEKCRIIDNVEVFMKSFKETI